jgi:hypothetical protein
VLAEVNKYHSLSASAAVLADFTRPKEYTIECLILYAAGLRSNNAFVNVWLMIGLIVRLALRMGYHRDPKHYPNISVFNGEMRRRTWGIISMIDVLISFQLGLPSMVRTIQSDAEPPTNLLDRDFGPQTKVLPPGRSLEELTPSSYTRAKLKIVRVFANAAELSHVTVPPAYEEIMELDRQLGEAKAAVPPLLTMPDSDLVTDPAEQLMCRFNLDLLYLKTKLVLHRRYMLTPIAQLSPEEQACGIGNSRKICINCALRVLQHHQTIYTASQPGGQLESVKWYMGSISTHDFLLAAMIICMELSQQINDGSFLIVSGGRECPRQQAMLDALEKSQKIWEAASKRKHVLRQTGSSFQGSNTNTKGEHMFDETEKAARAMAVMLEKVRARQGRPRVPPMTDTETGHLRVDPNRAQGDESRFSEFVGGQGAPFMGLVSMHEWSDGSPNLPPDLAGSLLGGTPFSNNGPSQGIANNPVIFGDEGPGATSASTGDTHAASNPSSDPSPGQTMVDVLTGETQGSGQPDFSAINSMLDDINNGMNWQMWDNQITQGPQMEWPGETLSGDPAYEMYRNTRLGNQIVGGSGQIELPGGAVEGGSVVSGNATIPGGTGSLPQGQQIDMGGVMEDRDLLQEFSRGVGMGSNGGQQVDMNMSDGFLSDVGFPCVDGSLEGDTFEDVTFDLSDQLENYNRNGMYPATAQDWADWNRRKRMSPQT